MKKMNHHKKILAMPVVLILLGAAYYFLYFIKTPGYAVNQIRVAVEQRDPAKFQQYVDLDSILDKSFNDLIIAESKINNNRIAENPFALGVLNMLKPTVIQLMKQQALNAIADKPQPTEAKVKDPVSDAMRRNIERKCYLDKLTYKSLKLDQKNDKEATVNVVFANDDLQKDFAFSLRMVKNKANTWQVTEIANLSAVVIQMDAAYKAKKASENQHILDRLKQNISVNDKTLTVTMVKAGELSKKVAQDANTGASQVRTIAANVMDAEKMEPCLSSKVLLKNISKQTITRVYYEVEILNKEKKTIYSYPESYNGKLAPEATTQVVAIKKLNTELPDDRMLAGKKDQNLDCNITITYIAFEDGSVISPNQFGEF